MHDSPIHDPPMHAGLAWLMLEAWGWRWFVGLCSVPVALALVGFIYLPESPHWLISQVGLPRIVSLSNQHLPDLSLL